MGSSPKWQYLYSPSLFRAGIVKKVRFGHKLKKFHPDALQNSAQNWAKVKALTR